ncbi:Uncharacterized protein FWK35_00026114, partial [Aphis craccivora]
PYNIRNLNDAVFSNPLGTKQCTVSGVLYNHSQKVHITSRNNAPISNFGGGFRCKSEYPWCIIEVKSKHFPTVFKKKIEKNKKKNNGKTGIFTQNQFSTKSIL